MALVVELEPARPCVLARDEALLAQLSSEQKAEFTAFWTLQTKEVLAATQAELMPGFEIMNAGFIARLQGDYELSCLKKPSSKPYKSLR